MSKDKPIEQLMPDDVFNQAVALFQQGYDTVAPYFRQLNASERKKALRLDAKKAAMMRKAPGYAATHTSPTPSRSRRTWARPSPPWATGGLPTSPPQATARALLLHRGDPPHGGSRLQPG